MKQTRMLTWAGLALAALLVFGSSGQLVQGQEGALQPRAVEQTLAGNAFSYQGYLTDGGSPANGYYDFSFSLYADAGGSQWVASAAPVGDYLVVDGVFTVEVDVSDPMWGDTYFYLNGDARWLRIGVRPGASTGLYTYLTPLQPLTPAPYALALPGMNTVQNNTSANVLGGYSWNYADPNIVGATISGGGREGARNEVFGSYSTVAGGAGNKAGGSYSFAAGRRAKANNTGSFVWADATDADFSSTADNQFRVRANGGMDVVGSTSSAMVTVTNSGGGDGISVPDGVDGIQIGMGGVYPLYGLYIPGPGTTYTALWPNTAQSSGEWGLYTPDKISAANVSLSSLSLLAVADDPQPMEAGTLVAVSGLAEPLDGSSEPLARVRAADSAQWTGVVGVVTGRMALQPAPDKEELQLRSADGPARRGQYVAIAVLGVAEVRAEPSAELSAGERLTAAGQPGTVRALQSRMVDGMEVAEGAPVVGVALGPVDEATGLVPVMVTLR